MPGAPFHTLFFANTSTAVAVTVGVQGYPTWQQAPLSLVMGSGLGPLLVGAWDRSGRAVAALRRGLQRTIWIVQAACVVARFDPERRRVATIALRLLNAPAYASARTAVRMTATTLGLNEPAAWRAISHDLHRKHMWAENAWRHLHACELADQLIRIEQSTVTNQDRNLVVELAYRGFAIQAHGSSKVTGVAS